MSSERIVAALLMAFVMAGIGYAIGQYAPFTGVAPLGEPFSPVRNQAATSYAIVGGIVGVLIGLAVKPHAHSERHRAGEEDDGEEQHYEDGGTPLSTLVVPGLFVAGLAIVVAILFYFA
jgi:hypothetical protein